MSISPYYSECFGIFALSWAAAFLATPFSIRLGFRTGLLDKPNDRRIHTQIIARSGGLALIFGFSAGVAAIWMLWPPQQGGLGPSWLSAFMLAASVIVLTGLYDDKKGLGAKGKISGQLLAALSIYLLTGQSFGSFMGYSLPTGIDLLLTLFWFLAVTNAFNLIDGLDGLCSGITVISALGLALSFIIRDMPGDSLVCFALAGAALGFLYYNFHPAKVFLGDAGSMFCGFCLAAMSLQTNGKSTFMITAGVPLLAAGVPAIDTLLAVWRRSARSAFASGKDNGNATGIMRADLEHLHHRLLALGFDQRQVATILYLATLLCVVLGLLSVFGGNTGVGLFLIIFTASIYILIRHVVHVELWDTARLLLRRIDASPRRGFISLFCYPFWDLAWLSVSFLISYWLLLKLTLDAFVFSRWLSLLSIWLPCPYIALILSNTYYKVWFHASIKDYLELVLAIASGTLVSIGIALLLQRDISYFGAILGLLFCLFSFIGIIGFRAVAPLFREWMLTTIGYHRPFGDAAPVQHVVLYGAGRRCGLFMRELHLSPYRETEAIRVIGIIDDSPFLRKRLVHGLRVLGSLDELEPALHAYCIEKIIVTTDLADAAMRRLKELAERNGIAVLGWRSNFYPL